MDSDSMLADAVTHLRSAEPYDLVHSVHGLGYINPHRLLPALAQALKPGGRLLFSVLHTNSAGAPPSSTVTPRPEILPLAGGGRLTVPCGSSPPRPGSRSSPATVPSSSGSTSSTLPSPPTPSPAACSTYAAC
ncbi:methyltransferase domain-containing protein [Streptomyces sp. NPDC000880]